MEKEIPVKIVTQEIMETLLKYKYNKIDCPTCNFRGFSGGCNNVLTGIKVNKQTGKIVERALINTQTGKKEILYRDYKDKIFKHLDKEKDLKERNLDKDLKVDNLKE